MKDAFLKDWPGAIDMRPLIREDSFQQKPFQYAVCNNRELYTGMKRLNPEAYEVIKENFKKRSEELIENL